MQTGLVIGSALSFVGDSYVGSRDYAQSSLETNAQALPSSSAEATTQIQGLADGQALPGSAASLGSSLYLGANGLAEPAASADLRIGLVLWCNGAAETFSLLPAPENGLVVGSPGSFIGASYVGTYDARPPGTQADLTTSIPLIAARTAELDYSADLTTVISMATLWQASPSYDAGLIIPRVSGRRSRRIVTGVVLQRRVIGQPSRIVNSE
jgi:hypothetical protein